MFTLYYADCLGSARNCLYPHPVAVQSEADLRRAVSHDYVAAEYRGGYRSSDTFLRSDCLAFDVDNDASENPADWITPEKLQDLLPGVRFAVHFSRSHMKEKNGKAARPKFHVLFPVEPITDAEEYRRRKKQVYRRFPFFDQGALDAARFFFGTKKPSVEIREGNLTLTEILEEEDFDAGMPQGNYGDRVTIEQGRRNVTLTRVGAKIVKRFGMTEEAFRMFTEEAERCRPPLSDRELGQIWNSVRRFGKKLQGQEGYIPPDKYKPGSPLKPADYSDIGQAKVLAVDCGSELAYSTGTDFLVYDGKRWVASRPKAVGCAESFLDRQLADAQSAIRKAMEELLRLGISEKDIAAGGKKLEKQIQGSQQLQAFRAYLAAQAYHSFVMKRRDFKYIQSALLAVKPMIEVEIQDIDSKGFLLNCPDGTYDLRYGMNGRRDHDASDYITMMTDYAPGDEGKELWLEALNRFFQGDRELIDYVQMTVGLCAIGEVFQEALTISYGVGSNGKSTFWNSVAAALGSYAGMISADTLTVGCRRNVKPELAEIKGKRILIAAELEEGMRLSTSIVKQLSSTDEIQGERKYCDPFKFKPTHSLILFTNHLPRVGAMDTGIWRRLIVIPFNASIRGNGEIKNYSKYLLDYAGPSIVKWIIEGAQKAYEAGFVLKPPRVVREAIDKYRADNDWLQHFLDECCEIGEGLTAKSGELYNEYRAYCARSGEYTRGTTEFYQILEQRGFVRRKTKKGAIVSGLSVVNFEH